MDSFFATGINTHFATTVGKRRKERSDRSMKAHKRSRAKMPKEYRRLATKNHLPTKQIIAEKIEDHIFGEQSNWYTAFISPYGSEILGRPYERDTFFLDEGGDRYCIEVEIPVPKLTRYNLSFVYH